MRLQACKDCKNSISTSAKSCPHCGAIPPKNSLGCTGVLTLLLLIWIIAISFQERPSDATKDNATERKAESARESRSTNIETHTSSHPTGKPPTETTRSESIACKKADALSMMIDYKNEKNRNERFQLINSGQCIFLKEGEKVAVISRAPYTALVNYKGTRFFTISSSLTQTPTLLAKSTNSAQEAPSKLKPHTQEIKLPAPFASPIQYIGLSLNEAAKRIGIQPNSVGNIILENATARILATTSGKSAISYVDIEFNQMKKCLQSKQFDSKPFLAALNIDPSKLELARKQTHFHTYYDHSNKLKIAVSCLGDNSPYNVGISKNNYLK